MTETVVNSSPVSRISFSLFVSESLLGTQFPLTIGDVYLIRFGPVKCGQKWYVQLLGYLLKDEELVLFFSLCHAPPPSHPPAPPTD